MNHLRIAFRLIVITATFFLQSCVDPASMTTTGAQVVYNRNSWQKTLNDQTITTKAYQKIYVYNNRYKDTSISISTFNGVVLMTGQIPQPVERQEIESIVRNIPGTQEVYNLTSLSQPVSALTQVGDSLITAKIKAKLIAANEIDPNQIKVITENGTVYLMGIIPHSQADAAIELARTTEGVQDVVKVFSYVHISKT